MTSAPARELADTFVKYLRDEGYSPSVTENGIVHVRIEGRSYVILPDDKDAEFFRLMLWLWSTKDELSRREAVEAANRATAQIKVAKVFATDGGDVYATVEMFFKAPSEVIAVFERCRASLAGAARSFSDGIRI